MDGKRNERVGGRVTTLQQDTAVEELIVAGKVGAWQFSGEVSGLFSFAMGEDWQGLIYAPVYVEFWKDVLAALDKRNETPVLLKIHAAYEFGVLSQTELEESMRGWQTARLTRTKPNMVSAAVRDTVNSDLTVNHLVIDEFEIVALDI